MWAHSIELLKAFPFCSICFCPKASTHSSQHPFPPSLLLHTCSQPNNISLWIFSHVSLMQLQNVPLLLCNTNSDDASMMKSVQQVPGMRSGCHGDFSSPSRMYSQIAIIWSTICFISRISYSLLFIWLIFSIITSFSVNQMRGEKLFGSRMQASQISAYRKVALKIDSAKMSSSDMRKEWIWWKQIGKEAEKRGKQATKG